MKKKIMKRVQAFMLSASLLLTMYALPALAEEPHEEKHIVWEEFYYDDKADSLSELNLQNENTDIRTLSTVQAEGKSFYESQLNTQAAYLYDLLEENIDKTYDGVSEITASVPEGIMTISDIRNGAYQYAIDAYRADHSSNFWLAYTKLGINMAYNPETGYVTDIILKPGTNQSTGEKYDDYYMDAVGNEYTNFGGEDPFTCKADVETALENVDTQVSDCLAAIEDCTTDYEKIKEIHDWLADHIVYNLNYMDQSLYAALVQGQGVCAGYVASFDYIAKKAGIHTIQVCGVAHSTDSQNENHAWNLVELDGQWYALDITWDDPADGGEPYYDFFLVGLDTQNDSLGGRTFEQSHELHNYFTLSSCSFALPAVSSTAFVYTGSNGNSADGNYSQDDEDDPIGNEPTITGKDWDVNRDGKKNLLDAQYTLQAVLKIINLSEEEMAIADMNRDKAVDLQDVQLVLKAALKIVDDVTDDAGTASGMTKLADYIKANGKTNASSGYQYISMIYENWYFSIAYKPNHVLDFSASYFEDNVIKSMLYWDYEFTSDNYVCYVYDVDEPGSYAIADFNIASYHLDSNLEFETVGIDDYLVSSYKKLSNSAARLAFAGWNELLNQKCQMNLKDIGFVNYD